MNDAKVSVSEGLSSFAVGCAIVPFGFSKITSPVRATMYIKMIGVGGAMAGVGCRRRGAVWWEFET